MVKKTLIVTLFLLSFVMMMLIGFYGFSKALVFINTGASKADMLLISTEELLDFYQPKVEWIENKRVEGRPLDPSTQTKITNNYLAGYYFSYQATGFGFVKGLKDYFTKKAREQMLEFIDFLKKDGQVIKGTTVQHLITPKFYSEDGILAVIQDQVISFNKVIKDGNISSSYDTSSFEIMLLLEDNFWRIRHKVRIDNSLINIKPLDTTENDVVIKGNKFYREKGEFRMKCMNYYPKDYPWQEMWNNFEKIDFTADIKRIKSLGFNTIRIFIPYDMFGKANVDARHLENLNKLLDITDDQDVKVIVTLFDFFLDYNLVHWTTADRHLEQLVNGIGHHTSLLAWDLKNEPDLDFETQGREEVVQWLTFIGKRLRTYDQTHYITIGWSQPEVSESVSEVVDFISFHFYRSTDELGQYLKNQASGNKKPLFLGELGMHSYDSWWFPFGKSEEEQAAYVSEILSVVRTYEINYGIWTLYDFKNIPDNVAGKVPWKRNPQKKYGLIDKKNRNKKIYDIILKFNCYDTAS